MLYRYAHAVDRCDAELLRSVYWPEGTDDHGDFKGKRDDFIAWVMPTMIAEMSMSQHLMVNTLIRIEGKIAKVETYFQAYHRWKTYEDKDAWDFVIAGRYLDRMEKRGKEWKVIERVVIFDYFREYDDTGNWKKSDTVNGHRTLGVRAPGDAASKLFGDSRFKAPFGG